MILTKFNQLNLQMKIFLFVRRHCTWIFPQEVRLEENLNVSIKLDILIINSYHHYFNNPHSFFPGRKHMNNLQKYFE